MITVPAAAVVIVPVARPLAPFAVAAIDHLEVGAAATIDPDAVAVVAPCTVEDAIGFTALANDEDAVERVDGTEVRPHIVGGAVDECGGAGLPVSGDAEVRTAAAVNPNATFAVAPSFAVDATGLAALANQAHTEAGIGGTPDALHGIGGAVDHVGIAPAAELVVVTAELTVAAAVASSVTASAVDSKEEKLLI